MPFDPILAAIRFGNGFSPTVAPPASAVDMLALLAGPDVAAQTYAIPSYNEARPSRVDFQLANAAVNNALDEAAKDAGRDARTQLREDARNARALSFTSQLARDITTADGFRERLVRFWTDHFTAPASNGQWRHLVYSNIEQSIRPHVAGQFSDLLQSAAMTPLMVRYLSQNRSVGPNSRRGRSSGRGLNENLAREILELHTLGVSGAYTQADVREFAELLTGVTTNAERGAHFNSRLAEPGPETVLGQTYGGETESFDHVLAALDDFAHHPDTARHLSEKLVTHFIGPAPQPDLVAQMASTFEGTKGNLLAVYDVLLSHEAAWAPTLNKVKQPYDFMAASMRALAVPPERLHAATHQEVTRFFFRPLTYMGQTIHQALAPDGWPEENEAWINPQGMAGRITWAMQTPRRLLDDLPDPRDFVHHALGPNPPDAVVFAANAAETISDGVGLVLASAAFQRR